MLYFLPRNAPQTVYEIREDVGERTSSLSAVEQTMRQLFSTNKCGGAVLHTLQAYVNTV